MRLCYIDESGDTGTVASPTSPVQPVLVIGAVVLDHYILSRITTDFINLKTRFSPRLAAGRRHRLSLILNEMKGTDIRKDAGSGDRRRRRRALGFLDKFMEMLEYNKVRIFGRVWIKHMAYPMDGNAVFTSSIQAIFQTFQRHLEQANDTGFVIADSRTPGQNSPVSHSIFTQKFKITGDPYARIWEMPTFGHSNNHVGLQLADLLVSSLLFPISCYAYCTGHITNTMHVKPGYQILRDRYGERLKRLQFRFKNHDGQMKGGFTVSDMLGQKNGSYLFSDPAGRPRAVVTPAPTMTAVPPVAPVSSGGVTFPATTVTTTPAPPPTGPTTA